MSREQKTAAVYAAITAATVYLTYRAWEVTKRDLWELEARGFDGYTRVSAHAAVRRERLRFIAQLGGHWVGIPFLFLPPRPQWVPSSPWRALAPWALITTHSVVLVNTLLDFYDRRRALRMVIELPQRTGWRRWLWPLWSDE